MAKIEKTVFISYRRRDISWALAVYQYLSNQNYDVFFDYTHIPSGDFEQIIISNIKARAHFVLILTPDALDRTSNEGDWLRREIETAIDEKRNIVPLFFDGFSFGSPNVKEKLTGKMASISRYNGLDIPSGYFPEAMERLSKRYLNTPLDAVIHPVSTEVRKKSREEKVAANKALREQKEDIEKLVKREEEKPARRIRPLNKELSVSLFSKWKNVVERVSSWFEKIDTRKYGMGISILLIGTIVYFGINSLIQYLDSGNTPSPTQTQELIVEAAKTSTRSIPTNTAIIRTTTSTATQIISTRTATNSPTSFPSLTSTPAPLVSPKDGMNLLYVSAGEFTMGSGEGDDDEIPVHTVYLDSFWIDKTEITNDMYNICVQNGVCNPPFSNRLGLIDNYYYDDYYDNYPVVYVLWEDADAYCSWAGRRLPTEAEWEKAASWNEAEQVKTVYPWGNIGDCSLANYSGTDDSCKGGYTSSVDLHLDGKSSFGALDMAGNVWEWVSDWYDSTYYQNSPLSNPEGPLSGTNKVIRGGYWANEYSQVRSSNRGFKSPTDSWGSQTIGFRCAMDAE